MNPQFATGIPLLDDNIAGLVPKRSYLCYGAAGLGKSLLGLQFLDAGLRQGERALLVTHERPRDLLAEGHRFGFQLEPALADGRLVILEFDRDFATSLLRYGWNPCLEQLRQLGGGGEAGRAVFDPVHPMFAGLTDEARLRSDMRYFVGALEDWGWTTLFLNDATEMMRHPSFARVSSEICWGSFELQAEMGPLESSNYLFVHKMRGATGPRRRIPFRIDGTCGLVEAEAPPLESAAPRATVAADEGTRTRTVLLADDDPFILKLLRKNLDDFHVLGAADGLEALTMTLREKPDVVVLDVQLPKISGFDVCRSLRECGFDVPILFVSGMAVDSNDRLRGILLGGNDYITKPFHAREVAEKIRAASRYRVALPERGTDAMDLDQLIEAALRRTVSPQSFYEMCAQACANAARFTAPLGIVRLCWDSGPLSDATRSWLLAAAERVTRPEDPLALLGAEELLVLLHTEDLRSTLAYLRDLRQALGTTRPEPCPAVRVGFAVYDPRTMPTWDAETALALVRRDAQDLFGDTRVVTSPLGNP